MNDSTGEMAAAAQAARWIQIGPGWRVSIAGPNAHYPRPTLVISRRLPGTRIRYLEATHVRGCLSGAGFDVDDIRIPNIDTVNADSSCMYVTLHPMRSDPVDDKIKPEYVDITTNGTTRRIPADEPVFLLRAQDQFAAQAVRMWAERVTIAALSRGEPSPPIALAALEHAKKMDAWPIKKQPDLPTEAAKPEATHIVGFNMDEIDESVQMDDAARLVVEAKWQLRATMLAGPVHAVKTADGPRLAFYGTVADYWTVVRMLDRLGAHVIKGDRLTPEPKWFVVQLDRAPTRADAPKPDLTAEAKCAAAITAADYLNPPIYAAATTDDAGQPCVYGVRRPDDALALAAAVGFKPVRIDSIRVRTEAGFQDDGFRMYLPGYDEAAPYPNGLQEALKKLANAPIEGLPSHSAAARVLLEGEPCASPIKLALDTLAGLLRARGFRASAHRGANAVFTDLAESPPVALKEIMCEAERVMKDHRLDALISAVNTSEVAIRLSPAASQAEITAAEARTTRPLDAFPEMFCALMGAGHTPTIRHRFINTNSYVAMVQFLVGLPRPEQPEDCERLYRLAHETARRAWKAMGSIDLTMSSVAPLYPGEDVEMYALTVEPIGKTVTMMDAPETIRFLGAVLKDAGFQVRAMFAGQADRSDVSKYKIMCKSQGVDRVDLFKALTKTVLRLARVRTVHDRLELVLDTTPGREEWSAQLVKLSPDQESTSPPR